MFGFCLRKRRPGFRTRARRRRGQGFGCARVFCRYIVSWGGGREICRRPGAAHACKQCLVSSCRFCCTVLVPQGVPLQERKRTCRALAYLVLAARIGVAADFGTRASINSAHSESPHDFSDGSGSTRCYLQSRLASFRTDQRDLAPVRH